MVRDEISHSVRNDNVGLCTSKAGIKLPLLILRYAQDDRVGLWSCCMERLHFAGGQQGVCNFVKRGAYINVEEVC